MPCNECQNDPRCEEMCVKYEELTKLRSFYREVAELTAHHDIVEDCAVVFPSKLGQALERVDANWSASGAAAYRKVCASPCMEDMRGQDGRWTGPCSCYPTAGVTGRVTTLPDDIYNALSAATVGIASLSGFGLTEKAQDALDRIEKVIAAYGVKEDQRG